MRREEHPRCWTIFTRIFLIPQMTLKVDFLNHRSRITIQYFALQNKYAAQFMRKRNFNNKKYIYNYILKKR